MTPSGNNCRENAPEFQKSYRAGTTEHAAAAARILELAAKRIREGEHPADVIQKMALIDVIVALSGRI